MHDVCPSSRPSVCLSRLSMYRPNVVDSDHIVQQKVEIGYDRIGRCLGYLHA